MGPASGHPAMRSAQGLRGAALTPAGREPARIDGHVSGVRAWPQAGHCRHECTRPCEAMLGAQPHARRQHYCRIRVGCTRGWAGMPPFMRAPQPARAERIHNSTRVPRGTRKPMARRGHPAEVAWPAGGRVFAHPPAAGGKLNGPSVAFASTQRTRQWQRHLQRETGRLNYLLLKRTA